MRKWTFRILGCFVALVLLAFMGLWLTSGSRHLTWEDYDRVEAGVGKLTEDDVVRILRRPPDQQLAQNDPALRWHPAHRAKVWNDGAGGKGGDGFSIEVIFDSKGFVAAVDFDGNATPEPFLSKIRRCLHLD